MKALTRFLPAAAAALAVAAIAAPAASAATQPANGHGASGAGGAVFALSDNTTANTVAAFHRAPNGTLTPAGNYATGGRGIVLPTSVVDHTASQGALAYDQARGLLIAVNPGSNTISVFHVDGDRLKLSQVLPSGGDVPVSVTVHGDQAYVLNTEGGGSLYGYQIAGGRLAPIPGSYRALGLGTTATTAFGNDPGQVAFTPNGSQVLVTTKGSTSAVDVFAVEPDGRLSASPAVNSLPGASPYAVTFDQAGQAAVAEGGPNAIATFTVSRNGKLTQLDAKDTGQMATCWVVEAGQYLYTSNAASGSLSGYQVGWSGALTALGNTKTDAGTVDAASAQGRFVYVQTGAAGVVDEFAVGAHGALTSIGSVTVPGGAGGEGIAAA
ncbi:MAG TPA: beta-propeller fold lactonase family protein [Trebonia sp.]